MLHNLIRLARHDVRVHVRRRVVHIPVRQTALRPVATVATEQGKDAHRFPCHVKVIFCHVGDSITFFSVCVGCASRFHHRGKALSCRTPRRVNPPNLPFYCGGVSPPFPLAAYAAATGGLQERLATKLVYTLVAGLSTHQHDKPHSDPWPRGPPNRATATIVLLNHNPSHSYVVSLPDATVGILPMSDAISILEQ